ncbi:FACT complex subunit SSRP1 [Nesidiocoris tenuis]|uniref:Odorant receptor n=1 Tax=Nesidiocoris tenuis TaxID=355587 RepID=A0ABN7BDP6_9HEMI|nr:FACT complex subunit SSRP1 [Nesidiocoris tenuis]
MPEIKTDLSKQPSMGSSLPTIGKFRPARAWNELTAGETDEAFKKGYGQNYGLFLTIGGHYWGTSYYRLAPIWFLTFGCWCQLLIIGAVRKALKTMDMEPMSENLLFIVMAGNMMLISINYLYYRKFIDDFFTAAGAGFFDYGDTLDSKTRQKIEKLVTETARNKERAVSIFGIIVSICSAGMLAKTVGNYFIRYRNIVDVVDTEISKKQLIAFWFYGIEHWPMYLFCCTSLYSMQLFLMNNIASYVASFIAFSETIVCELQIVSLGFREVTARAKHICKLRYGEFEKADTLRYDACLREALRASVRHHIVTLEILNGFRAFMSFPLFTVMLTSALMLCMSGYLLTADGIPLPVKGFSSLMATAVSIYSFLFCNYGERINEGFNDVGDQLYADKWMQSSRVIKPYMAMVKNRCTQPIKLSGGGILEVNLDAFSNVIKTAFSYINFLRTLSNSSH